MNEELDKKLCENYPQIFADRNSPMTHTAMCWGFCCGDGWYNIIDKLCRLITSDYRSALNSYNYALENLGKPKLYSTKKSIHTQEEVNEAKIKLDFELAKIPKAMQVKEKFGTLSFYISGGNDKVYAYIAFAEAMSSVTCETCGSPATINRDGWHKCICKTCLAKEKDGLEMSTIESN